MELKANRTIGREGANKLSGNGLVHTLDMILKWVTRITAVNLLWIIFSLIGLIVGGVFPATVASLSISRKWLIGEIDIPIWETFKDTFKREFIISNLSGWLLVIVGSILYANYKVLLTMSGKFLLISTFAFYLLLLFYFLLVIWIFPLISHYNGTMMQHIKNAIILGLGKIHISLASLLWLFLVAYFSLKLPSSLLFVSVAIGSLGWAWISLRTFNVLDQKKT